MLSSHKQLTSAARRGNIEEVQSLLDQGISVNAPNMHGETPLHFIARSGEKNMAQFFLDRKASVKIKDRDQHTPLHYAAEYGNEKVVSLFLKRGADIEALDMYGGTPLLTAVYYKQRKLTDLLLNKGANVNARCNTGRNILEQAIFDERVDPIIVTLLLKNGAKVSKELIENCIVYDETKECYEKLSTLLAEVSLEKTSIQDRDIT